MLLDRVPNWTILKANHGQEALSILDAEAIDLVMTDVMMPVMDGLELIDAMQASFPNVPAVLIPCHAQEEATINALRLGAATYSPSESLTTDLIHVAGLVLRLVESQRTIKKLNGIADDTEFQMVLNGEPATWVAAARDVCDRIFDLGLLPDRFRIQMGAMLYFLAEDAFFNGSFELVPNMRHEQQSEFEEIVKHRRSVAPFNNRRAYFKAQLSSQSAFQLAVMHEGGTAAFATSDDVYELADPHNLTGRSMLHARMISDIVQYKDTSNELVLTFRR